MLGSVSGAALAIWFAVECAGFLLARVAAGQWRLYTSAGESTVFSLCVHVGWYLSTLAAPFTGGRAPFLLSPSVYGGSVVYTLACSNPLMLELAYKFSSDKQPKPEWQTAAMALGATSALSVVGAICTLASTNERFRSTFYKHCTCAEYVRNDWDGRTTVTIRGKIVTDCGRELVRIKLMKGYNRCYWPMDLVEPFVRENWWV